jgi:hypothetical protein
MEKTGSEISFFHQNLACNYSAAENYRNITLRAVMIFYSPIGSRDSKISMAQNHRHEKCFGS